MKNSNVRFSFMLAIPALLMLCCMLAGCVLATVGQSGMRSESKSAADHVPLPRVMVLIQENALGTIPTDEVEKIAIQKLIEQGVDVVGRDMAKTKGDKDAKLLKMMGDAQGAAAVGLQFGADIVITGDAVSKPSASRIGSSQLRTYQATVSLAATRTDSARVIATASRTKSAVDVEDMAGSVRALHDAGQESLDVLLLAMLGAWQKQSISLTQAQNIELTVGGVNQMWMVRAIREQMRNEIEGLRNVLQRDYVSGVVTFSLEGNLAAEQLAEELVLNPPKGIRFQVLAIQPRQISLKALVE